MHSCTSLKLSIWQATQYLSNFFTAFMYWTTTPGAWVQKSGER